MLAGGRQEARETPEKEERGKSPGPGPGPGRAERGGRPRKIEDADRGRGVTGGGRNSP